MGVVLQVSFSGQVYSLGTLDMFVSLLGLVVSVAERYTVGIWQPQFGFLLSVLGISSGVLV